jgi:hypothetical protein
VSLRQQPAVATALAGRNQSAAALTAAADAVQPLQGSTSDVLHLLSLACQALQVQQSPLTTHHQQRRGLTAEQQQQRDSLRVATELLR